MGGLILFLLGIAIAFTDLLKPGGWKLLGGILVIVGAIEAVISPAPGQALDGSTGRLMKRFWKSAAVVGVDGDYGVELDGRPVKTPARAGRADVGPGRGDRRGME